MPMPGGTIAHWTPADLQAWLQGVARLEQTAFPSSLSVNQVAARELHARESLNLDAGTQIMKDGEPYPPASFLGVGSSGGAEPMYGEMTGTALWRAAGGTIVSQVADLPDQTDAGGLTNQRVHSSLIYVPSRSNVRSILAFVVGIPTAFSGSSSGARIWMPVGAPESPSFQPVTNPGVTLLNNIDGSGSYVTGSTGLKVFPLDKTYVLDAGVYLVGMFFNWSSITGSLQFASRNTTNNKQNDGFLGAYQRTAFIDGRTTLPDTWAPAGRTLNRVWYGLSSE